MIRQAREVIHSKGYKAAGVNDIMTYAHIGKGQFYSSKHDLGLAVVEQLTRKWEEKIVGIIQADGAPQEKLSGMLNWIIGYHKQANDYSECPIGNLALEMSEQDEEFYVFSESGLKLWRPC
ncbi:TetR/AcrR family transcriptional regulator [Metabacillus sp. 84]|uniref:TetR/AcrR family transcriptional regulator n=1 Tax=Metabacillus sp. 84 TaxID=3404705 RepID=UPI003CEF75D3